MAFMVLLTDLFINFFFTFIQNLLIIYFNYFGGILVIFIQMIGFYYVQLAD